MVTVPGLYFVFLFPFKVSSTPIVEVMTALEVYSPGTRFNFFCFRISPLLPSVYQRPVSLLVAGASIQKALKSWASALSPAVGVAASTVGLKCFAEKRRSSLSSFKGRISTGSPSGRCTSCSSFSSSDKTFSIFSVF